MKKKVAKKSVKKSIKMVEVTVRSGSMVRKEDAESVYNELEEIRASNNGEIVTEKVIEKARDKSTVLHNYFEWDDSLAAEKFRKVQARTIIRDIQVVTPDREMTSRYVHVKTNPKSGSYQTMDTVVRCPDRFELAFEALVQKLESARKAAQELEDAAKKSPQKHKLEIIMLAVKGIEAAVAAVRKIA